MENPFVELINKMNDLESKLNHLLSLQESSDPTKGNELMNINEVASFLDESVHTIYNRTSNRTIPFYKKGKKLLFKKSEILDWLDSKRKMTISELKENL